MAIRLSLFKAIERTQHIVCLHPLAQKDPGTWEDGREKGGDLLTSATTDPGGGKNADRHPTTQILKTNLFFTLLFEQRILLGWLISR